MLLTVHQFSLFLHPAAMAKNCPIGERTSRNVTLSRLRRVVRVLMWKWTRVTRAGSLGPPEHSFLSVLTDGLVVCHLPFGPTAYFTLYNVVMRHDVPDIGTMSEAYPHLIFHNFTSRLGKRVRERGGVRCSDAGEVVSHPPLCSYSCWLLLT